MGAYKLYGWLQTIGQPGINLINEGEIGEYRIHLAGIQTICLENQGIEVCAFECICPELVSVPAVNTVFHLGNPANTTND